MIVMCSLYLRDLSVLSRIAAMRQDQLARIAERRERLRSLNGEGGEKDGR